MEKPPLQKELTLTGSRLTREASSKEHGQQQPAETQPQRADKQRRASVKSTASSQAESVTRLYLGRDTNVPSASVTVNALYDTEISTAPQLRDSVATPKLPPASRKTGRVSLVLDSVVAPRRQMIYPGGLTKEDLSTAKVPSSLIPVKKLDAEQLQELFPHGLHETLRDSYLSDAGGYRRSDMSARSARSDMMLPPSLASNLGSLFPSPSEALPISLDQALLRVDLDDALPPGIATGEDCVTLLMREKHREGQNLYCLLANKDPMAYDPYDLVAVKRSQIQTARGDYFTVSVEGVAFIRNDDICEVLELQDWLQQKAVFSMIRKYDFFRNFAKRKFFFLWRSIARELQFRRARLKVSQNLLHLDPSMGPALIKVNSLISDGCTAAIGREHGAVGGWMRGSDGKWRTLDDHQRYLIQLSRAKRSKRDAREAELSAMELTSRIKNRSNMHVITEALRGSGLPLLGQESSASTLQGGDAGGAQLSAQLAERSQAGMDRPLTVFEMRDRANDVLRMMRTQLSAMERHVVQVLDTVRSTLEASYEGALPKHLTEVDKWEKQFLQHTKGPWTDRSISVQGNKERSARDRVHIIRKEADKLRRLVHLADLILMETVAQSGSQAVRDMYTTLNEMSGLFLVRVGIKSHDAMMTVEFSGMPSGQQQQQQQPALPRTLTAVDRLTGQAQASEADIWSDVFSLEKQLRDPLAIEGFTLPKDPEEAARAALRAPKRTSSFNSKRESTTAGGSFGRGLGLGGGPAGAPMEKRQSGRMDAEFLTPGPQNRRQSQLTSRPTAPPKSMAAGVRKSVLMDDEVPSLTPVAPDALMTAPDGTVLFTPQEGVSNRYRRDSVAGNRRASVAGRRVSFLPGDNPAAALAVALKDAVPGHVLIESTIDDLGSFVPWLVSSLLDMYASVRAVSITPEAVRCLTLQERVIKQEKEMDRQAKQGPTAHKNIAGNFIIESGLMADALAAGLNVSPPASPKSRPDTAFTLDGGESSTSQSDLKKRRTLSPPKSKTADRRQMLTRLPTIKSLKEVALVGMGQGLYPSPPSAGEGQASIRSIMNTSIESLSTTDQFGLRLKVDFFAAVTHILLRPLLATGHVYKNALVWNPNQFDNPETSADAFYRYITGSRAWLKIVSSTTDKVTIGLITLDAAAVKKGMIPVADKILRTLTELVSKAVLTQCRRLRDQCMAAVSDLQQRPKELQDFTDFISSLSSHFSPNGDARIRMEQEYRIARRLYHLLNAEFPGQTNPGSTAAGAQDLGGADRGGERPGRDALAQGSFASSVSASGSVGPPPVDSAVSRCWTDAQRAYDEYDLECSQALEFVNSYRSVAASALMRSTMEAESQVRDLMRKLRSPILCGSASLVPDALAELDSCEPLLGQLVGALEQFGRHQEVLKASIIGRLQLTVSEARQMWLRKKDLWMAIGAWREFLQRLGAPLAHLDGLVTSDDVVTKIHVVEENIKYIEDSPLAASVYDTTGYTAEEKALAAELRERMESVRQFLPVLGILYHAHMKERHRRVLFRRLYQLESLATYTVPEADGGRTFTMRGMLALVLDSEQAKRWLNDIFKVAKREAELMDLLENMQRSLYAMIILMEKDHDVELNRISNLEECQRRLHECTADVDTLMSSKYIEGISRAFSNIQHGLHHMKRVLAAARECQEGVFTLSRLLRRMTGSYWAKLRGYEVADVARRWSLMLNQVSETPKLVRACAEGGPMDPVLALNDEVQKLLSGLTVLLEDARQVCPRLFFVDDRGLVRALAVGADIRANTWVLNACFPGIGAPSVITSGTRQTIPGVYGLSGEYVEFPKPIEAGTHKELPFVLCDFEAQLLLVLKATTGKSFKTLAQLPGVVTAEEEEAAAAASLQEGSVGPLQTVIVLEMLLWTLTITDALLAIQRGDKDALERAHGSLQDDIEQLYLLVSGKDMGTAEEGSRGEEDMAGAPGGGNDSAHHSGHNSHRPSHHQNDHMGDHGGGGHGDHVGLLHPVPSMQHRRSGMGDGGRERRISGFFTEGEDGDRHKPHILEAEKKATENNIRRTHMLSALALAIVNRDRTADLIQRSVESPGDFYWVRQARYYYDLDVGSTVVMVGDNRFMYGFEYDGGDVEHSLMPAVISNSMPQVLAMASSLHFSPCHAVRAGSGSPTPAYAARALARALGRLFHEASCSPTWNTASVTRVLRGSMESGAILFLDRAELLSPDMLSLLSQHIRDLSAAVKSASTRCDLCLGQPVNLVRLKPTGMAHSMGIFIGLPPEDSEVPARLDMFARRLARSVVLRGMPQQPLFAALFTGYGLESGESNAVASCLSKHLQALESNFPHEPALARAGLGLAILRELHDRLGGPRDDMNASHMLRVLRLCLEHTVVPLVGSDAREVVAALSEEFLMGDATDRKLGVAQEELEALTFYEPLRPIIGKAFDVVARDIKCSEFAEEEVVPSVMRMVQILSSRRSMVLLGTPGAGKSLTLRVFFETMRILLSAEAKQQSVHKVYPAALTLSDLVGDNSLDADFITWGKSVLGNLLSRHSTKTGIGNRRASFHSPQGLDKVQRRMSSMGVTEVRRLPKELRDKLGALLQCSNFLLFDGHLGGDVAEALAPALVQGFVYPPDGSISALPESYRIVWECTTLQDAPPALATGVGIASISTPVVKLTMHSMRTALEARLGDCNIGTAGIRHMAQIVVQAIHAAYEMGQERHVTWEAGMAQMVVDLLADLFSQVDVSGAPTTVIDPNAVAQLDVEPIFADMDEGDAAEVEDSKGSGQKRAPSGARTPGAASAAADPAADASEAADSLGPMRRHSAEYQLPTATDSESTSLHSMASENDDLHPIYRRLLGYVLAWALGGGLDKRGQATFELRLREYGALDIGDSSNKSVYQTFVDIRTGGVVPCGANMELALSRLKHGVNISESVYDDAVGLAPRKSLFVPTGGTLALQHAVRVFLRSGRPALVVGPPSCGKTEALTRVLLSYHGSSMVYLPLSTDQTARGLSTALKSALIRRRNDLYTLKLGHSVPILIDDVHVMSLAGMRSSGLDREKEQQIPAKDTFEPGAYAWIRHFCEMGAFMSESCRETFQVPRAWIAISGCQGPLTTGPWKMSSRLTRHLWTAYMSEWLQHSSPSSLFMYQVSSPILRQSVEHELKAMLSSVPREHFAMLTGVEDEELQKVLKEEQSWLTVCVDALSTALLDLGSRLGSILSVDGIESPRALHPNLRSLVLMLSDIRTLLREQTILRRKLLPNSVPRLTSTFVFAASSVLGDRVEDPAKLDGLREAIISVAVKSLVPLDRGLQGTIALDSEALTAEHLDAVSRRGYVNKELKVVADDPRLMFESLHGALLDRRAHVAFEITPAHADEEAAQAGPVSCFKRAISRLLLPDMPTRVHRLAFALDRPTVTDYLCLTGSPGCGRRSALRMACALIDARYHELPRTTAPGVVLQAIERAAAASFVDSKNVVLCIPTDPPRVAHLLPIIQLVNQGVFPLSLQSVVEPDLLRDSERGAVVMQGPSKPAHKAVEQTRKALERIRVVLLIDSIDLSPVLGCCPALVGRARVVHFSSHSNEGLIASVQLALYNLPSIAQARAVNRQNRRASGTASMVTPEATTYRPEKMNESGMVRQINDQFNQLLARDVDVQKLSKLAAGLHEAATSCLENWGVDPGAYAPTRCLQMLSVYMSLMEMQETSLREEFTASKWAIQEIEHLQGMLEDMQTREQELAPQLADVISAANDIMMDVTVLEHEHDDAERKLEYERSRVEEAITTIQSLVTAADADVQMVSQAYRQILLEITSLNDQDLHEIRSYMGHNPPLLVKNVILCCCAVLNLPEDWEAARKMMTDTDRSLLTRIAKYDISHIGEKKLAKIKKYIEMPSFKPAAVAQVSRAVRSLCEWVLRVYDYGSVRVMVDQKGTKIIEGRIRIDKAKDYVSVREETVVALKSRIRGLRAKRVAYQDKQKELDRELAALRRHMEAVQEALEFLRSEESRWTGSLKAMASFAQELRGNAMLGAASVIYLGQLRPERRSEMLVRWFEVAKDLKVPFARDFSLASFLEEGGVKLSDAPNLLLPQSAMNNLLAAMLAPGPTVVMDASGEAQLRLQEIQGAKLWHVLEISTGRGVKEEHGVHQVLKTGGVVMGMVQEGPTSSDPYRWLNGFYQSLYGGLDMLEEAKRATRKQIFLSTYDSVQQLPIEYSGTSHVIRFDVQRDDVEARLLSEMMRLREPEKEEAHRKLEVSVMHQQHAVRSLMSQLTDMICGLDDRALRDRVVIQGIVGKLQQLRSMEDDLSDDRDRLETLRTFSDSERAMAVLAGQVFVFLQDAAAHRPTFAMTIREYVIVFRQAVEVLFKMEEQVGAQGVLKWRSPLGAKLLDGLPQQLRRFAHELYARLTDRLAPAESALLGLMMSMLLLLDEGAISEDERKFTLVRLTGILHHSISPKLAVPSSGDLDRLLTSSMGEIHQLVDSYPNRVAVLGLQDSLSAQNGLWAAAFRSETPPANIPAPWNQRLSPPLKVLLLCTVNKSQAFVERMVAWLVAQVLDCPVPGSSAHVLRDMCDSLPPNITILLYDDPGGKSHVLPDSVEAAHALAPLTPGGQGTQGGMSRGGDNASGSSTIGSRDRRPSTALPNILAVHPDIVHVHLSSATVSTFIAAVRMAMATGMWVVAYDAHTDLHWEPQLRLILHNQVEEIKPGFRIIFCMGDQDVERFPSGMYSWCAAVSSRPEPSPAHVLARCIATMSQRGTGIGAKDQDLQRMVAIRWLGLCLLHTSLACGWVTEPMDGLCGIGISGEDLARTAAFISSRTENFAEARPHTALKDQAREVVTLLYSLSAMHVVEQERLSLILSDIWSVISFQLHDADVEVIRRCFVRTRNLHAIAESLAPIITRIFDVVSVRHEALMVIAKAAAALEPYLQFRPVSVGAQRSEGSDVFEGGRPGLSNSGVNARTESSALPVNAISVPYSFQHGMFQGTAETLLDLLDLSLPNTLQEQVMAAAPLSVVTLTSLAMKRESSGIQEVSKLVGRSFKLLNRSSMLEGGNSAASLSQDPGAAKASLVSLSGKRRSAASTAATRFGEGAGPFASVAALSSHGSIKLTSGPSKSSLLGMPMQPLQPMKSVGKGGHRSSQGMGLPLSGSLSRRDSNSAAAVAAAAAGPSKAARARRRSSLAPIAGHGASDAGGGLDAAAEGTAGGAQIQVKESLMEELALVRELQHSTRLAPIRCSALVKPVDGLPARLVRALVLNESVRMGRALSTWADLMALTVATRGFVATTVPEITSHVQEGSLVILPASLKWSLGSASETLFELKRKFWSVAAATEGRSSFLWDLSFLSCPQALVTAAWISTLDNISEDRCTGLVTLHPEELRLAATGVGMSRDSDGDATTPGPVLTSLTLQDARFDLDNKMVVPCPGAYSLPPARMRHRPVDLGRTVKEEGGREDTEIFVTIRAPNGVALFTAAVPADRVLARSQISRGACILPSSSGILGAPTVFKSSLASLT